MSNGDSFDIGAAWMRRAQGDMKAFLEAFAARMEGAVPDRVNVERRRDGLFSAHTHIARVTLDAGAYVYQLELSGPKLEASRVQTIRGVRLRSEEMPVPDWLAALNADLQDLAERTGSAHTVLHDFLMS